MAIILIALFIALMAFAAYHLVRILRMILRVLFLMSGRMQIIVLVTMGLRLIEILDKPDW